MRFFEKKGVFPLYSSVAILVCLSVSVIIALGPVSLTLAQCPVALLGDLNDDCKVDLQDFAVIATYWLVDCNSDPNLCPPVGVGRLKCDNFQTQTVTQNAWTTIFDLSDGPQVGTTFWFAVMIYDDNKEAQLSRLKFTFDGTATIEACLGEFFGGGFDDDGTIFRAHWNGVTRNVLASSSRVSGYLRLLMPYQSTCKVEFFNASTDTNGIAWAMFERMPLTFPIQQVGLLPRMHLYSYGYGQDGYVSHYTENTLLETDEPTILAGLFHLMENATTPAYVEGDYKIYYGGEGTPSYHASGTEDFYHSSWNFHEGAFAQRDMVLPKATTNQRVYPSRFFPLDNAPYDPNGLKLTWENGEAGKGDPGDTYIRWIVWYYK